MKSRMTVAIAIGTFFSLLLVLLGFTVRDDTVLQYLGMPGHVAIVAIFGAHTGKDLSVTALMIIGTCANIVVYSFFIFLILKLFARIR
jgi:hypothetical protein